MKYSKIEKAIVLSLLLSSSIYGIANASGYQYIDDSIFTEDYHIEDNNNKDMTFEGISNKITSEAYGFWVTAGERTFGDRDLVFKGLYNNLTIKAKQDTENGDKSDFAVGILIGRSEDVGSKSAETDSTITVNNNLKVDVISTNNMFAIGSWTRTNGINKLINHSEDIDITVNKNDGDNENEYLASAGGVRVDDNAHTTITAENGNIKIEANNNIIDTTKSYKNYDVEGITAKDTGSINLEASKNIDITANTYNGNAYGILSDSSKEQNKDTNNIQLNSNKNSIIATSQNGEAYAIYADNSNVNISADTINYLESTGNGITAQNNSNISFTGDTTIQADKNGIEVDNAQTGFNGNLNVSSNGDNSIKLTHGANLEVTGNTVINKEFSIDGDTTKGDIKGSLSGYVDGDAVVVENGATLDIGGNIGIEGSNNGLVISDGEVTVNNKNGYGTNFILGEDSAIKATNADINLSGNTLIANGDENNSAIDMNNSTFTSSGSTTIIGTKNAIVANDSSINLKGNSKILSGEQGTDENGNIFYDGIAINATGSDKENEKSEINALGANNTIGGTILASGVNTNVRVGNENYTSENNIYAKTHVVDEGENHIVSAVYAKDGATISLNGINNIGTLANSGHNDDKERTIWAEQGTININGLTNIHASNGSIENPNNVGIAIAAGGSDIKDDNDKTGAVNAVLNNGSYIFGDILAGKNGKVDLSINPIMPLNEDSISKSGITIQGNILAANDGEVNVNLGANSILTGRIDSYMDATAHPEHGDTFFAPEFSNEIETKGTVSLTLGENSRWNLIGQSWVTNLNINGTGTMIDMVGSNTDKNESSHALTIENLKGDANFKMSLKGDEAHSNATDMIYIKNGNGNFNVIVDEAITEEDINDNGLRFATIGSGSDVKFKNVGTYNAGAFDVKYAVESSAYTSNDEENDRYNGEDFSEDKPGSDNIDDFFKSEEESIATLSTETKESDESAIATNYNIVGIAGRELNNIGKTIINLSRANYANAIYMDNMNQRLGEARYLEGNEGFWVKLGHNSIGKDNAFDIDNNVYQLGYDKLHQEENGARRIGVVADYMTGDTSYDNISANGEVSRKGLWLYDTWTGNDGHYTDFVAKWGHLENNFDIYVPDRDVVNGEYNNDVFTLSEEYGYKKSLGNNWYIEPQIQLQYAYITGADYMTSQDTNVNLDAVNSLISRAGFRLGREFGKDNKTNLYLKGNIMHEFLGDQDIKTWDNTGVLNDTFDNDGTWYNIGIGVSTVLSDSSYAYVDYERSFGNDNDNTYQVNGGVRWAF